MSGISKACCSIPPIIAEGYQPKGEYKTINGLKTYITGPESATKAILVIYDIFGFFPQTLQGADILATSSTQKYRVFIPDFFHGSPADISWFPPKTDVQRNNLSHFFNTKAAPEATLPLIPGIVDEASSSSSSVSGGITSWTILGFCWGAKIAVLAAGAEKNKSEDERTFKAVVQCHPAMLDPEDAKAVSVPLALLASKDEKPGDVRAFEKNLAGVPHYVETFGRDIHGWMAARANLKNQLEVESYERGYRTVLGFLREYV